MTKESLMKDKTSYAVHGTRYEFDRGRFYAVKRAGYGEMFYREIEPDEAPDSGWTLVPGW